MSCIDTNKFQKRFKFDIAPYKTLTFKQMPHVEISIFDMRHNQLIFKPL